MSSTGRRNTSFMHTHRRATLREVPSADSVRYRERDQLDRYKESVEETVRMRETGATHCQ